MIHYESSEECDVICALRFNKTIFNECSLQISTHIVQWSHSYVNNHYTK